MPSQERRKQLRLLYGDLFDSVAAILFEADPVGINFGFNTDEYHPEVGTVLPRLKECQSAQDVQQVLYQEFVAWFDEHVAGPQARYAEPARKIWELWQQSPDRNTLAQDGGKGGAS